MRTVRINLVGTKITRSDRTDVGYVYSTFCVKKKIGSNRKICKSDECLTSGASFTDTRVTYLYNNNNNNLVILII